MLRKRGRKKVKKDFVVSRNKVSNEVSLSSRGLFRRVLTTREKTATCGK